MDKAADGLVLLSALSGRVEPPAPERVADLQSDYSEPRGRHKANSKDGATDRKKLGKIAVACYKNLEYFQINTFAHTCL
jgi:hypothetical protein